MSSSLRPLIEATSHTSWRKNLTISLSRRYMCYPVAGRLPTMLFHIRTRLSFIAVDAKEAGSGSVAVLENPIAYLRTSIISMDMMMVENLVGDPTGNNALSCWLLGRQGLVSNCSYQPCQSVIAVSLGVVVHSSNGFAMLVIGDSASIG